MLIVKAKVPFLMPDGRSTEYSGDTRFIIQCNGGIAIRSEGGSVEIPPSTWNCSSHKLKSKDAKGLVYVGTLQDGRQVQTSTKIDDIVDGGKALDVFF